MLLRGVAVEEGDLDDGNGEGIGLGVERLSAVSLCALTSRDGNFGRGGALR